MWAFKLGGRLQPQAPRPLPPPVQTFEGRGVVARTNEIVIDFAERDKDAVRPPGLRIDDYETFEPRRVEVRRRHSSHLEEHGARAAYDQRSRPGVDDRGHQA